MTEIGAIKYVLEKNQKNATQGRTKFYNEITAFAKEKNIIIELTFEEKTALQNVGVSIDISEPTHTLNEWFSESTNNLLVSTTELLQRTMPSLVNSPTNNTPSSITSTALERVDSMSKTSDVTETISPTISDEHLSNGTSVNCTTPIYGYETSNLISMSQLTNTFNETILMVKEYQDEFDLVFNTNSNQLNTENSSYNTQLQPSFQNSEVTPIPEELESDSDFSSGSGNGNSGLLIRSEENIDHTEQQTRITQETALKNQFLVWLESFSQNLKEKNANQQDERIKLLIRRLELCSTELNDASLLCDIAHIFNEHLMPTLEKAKITFQYETGILGIIQPIRNAISDLMAFLSSMVLSAESHQTFVKAWCQKPEPIANVIYKASYAKVGFFTATGVQAAIDDINRDYNPETDQVSNFL